MACHSMSFNWQVQLSGPIAKALVQDFEVGTRSRIIAVLPCSHFRPDNDTGRVLGSIGNGDVLRIIAAYRRAFLRIHLHRT